MGKDEFLSFFGKLLGSMGKKFLPELLKISMNRLEERYAEGVVDRDFLLEMADLLEISAQKLRSLAGVSLMDEVRRKAKRVEIKDAE